jgi:hypothetical protein
LQEQPRQRTGDVRAGERWRCFVTTQRICHEFVERFTGQAIPAPAGYVVVLRAADGRIHCEPVLTLGVFASVPVFHNGVTRPRPGGPRTCFSCGETEDEPVKKLVAMWRGTRAAILEDPTTLPSDVVVLGIFGPGEELPAASQEGR